MALSAPGAHDADYRHSGYSRGHMVPAEDMAWSSESVRATFVLSNAAPQRQDVNAGPWRRLEHAVRMAAARADATYVFTGPVFAGATTDHIGEGHVAVPSHFFKVVLTVVGNRKTMYAAIVPNDEPGGETLAQFATTVDEVERVTGLDFFHALDGREQRCLEAERNLYSVAETGKNSEISMIGRPPENTR